MSITKDQWTQIEAQLSGVFGRVELICDGYKINAAIQNVSPMKLGIVIYVDGITKGEWLFNKEESEIPQKFHHEIKHFISKPKMREWLIKQSKSRVWDKDRRDEFAADAKKTHSYWLPYWPNAKAFCRHIRKTCASIELVKIGH